MISLIEKINRNALKIPGKNPNNLFKTKKTEIIIAVANIVLVKKIGVILSPENALIIAKSV